LSALAALATSSSWRAFALGVRWGLGHSTGLIIMAGIFFAAGQTIDLDKIGAYCNYIVGIFMIALGVWTMYHVRRKYRKQCEDELLRESVVTPITLTNGHEHPSSTATGSPSQEPYYSTTLTPEQRRSSLVVVNAAVDDSTISGRGGVRLDESSPSVKEVKINVEDPANEKKATEGEGHAHSHTMFKCCSKISYSNPMTQRVGQLSCSLHVHSQKLTTAALA